MNTTPAKKLTTSDSLRYTIAQQPPRGAFKLKAAAEYLGGLSVPTMHRLIQRGLLRPNRSLRHHIFSREELERFLRAGQ